jgi:DnaJ-domain-containing protein 1
MGIWDRLGNVIKSYVNDERDKVFGKTGAKRHNDPDLNAAYEELDDFLRGKEASASCADFSAAEKSGNEDEKQIKTSTVPEEVRQDFAELGLTPDATAEECKEAYKKLLKIHHPDRHTNHDENMKKATDKAARVNAAYDRLVTWFRVQNKL